MHHNAGDSPKMASVFLLVFLRKQVTKGSNSNPQISMGDKLMLHSCRWTWSLHDPLKRVNDPKILGHEGHGDSTPFLGGLPPKKGCKQVATGPGVLEKSPNSQASRGPVRGRNPQQAASLDSLDSVSPSVSSSPFTSYRQGNVDPIFLPEHP